MSYIGNQPVLNTSEFREEFAVTSTQTVFNTGGFTASSDSATLEVLRNGVLLGTTDYTLGSDASTVTLANAAVSGDIIVIKGRRELTNGVQVTERRHEHTMGSGETTVTFPYPLTVSQTDVYLNGVKLGVSDFSINSSTRVVSFTTNPAVGDLVAIVSREPALTANSSLPVVDAAGNNVLSEANNVVSIGSGVQFPAGTQIGYNYHLKNTTQTITNSTSNTFTVITFDTNSTTSISAKGTNSLFEITASISFGQQDESYPAFKLAYSTDGSTFTDILGPTNGSATRATFGGQYGAESATEDLRLFNSTMTWIVGPSISAGGTFYYQVRGTNRGAGSSSISLLINSSWSTIDANRLTGVSSMVCREIAQ